MLAVFLVIVVALVLLAAALDVSARVRGHRVRAPGDIKAEIREQRRHLRARRTVNFTETGDDGADGSFSPDRERRLRR